MRLFCWSPAYLRDLKMARWIGQIAAKGCVWAETRMRSDQQNGDANLAIWVG
jgi:hypothetical protein